MQIISIEAHEMCEGESNKAKKNCTVQSSVTLPLSSPSSQKVGQLFLSDSYIDSYNNICKISRNTCLFSLFIQAFNIYNFHVLHMFFPFLETKLCEGWEQILSLYNSTQHTVTFNYGINGSISLLLFYFQNTFTHLK